MANYLNSSVMKPLYSIDEIRIIETCSKNVVGTGRLMECAGQAAFLRVMDLLPLPHSAAQVLILSGPGDNGGDALEVATRLAKSKICVTVVRFSNIKTCSEDARLAHQSARNAGVFILDALDWESLRVRILSQRWTMVIDGLFGIGLQRPIEGVLAKLIVAVNTMKCTRLSLDIPSGLDADTGSLLGDGPAFKASHTVTFVADKPGLYTAEGPDYAGIVHVADLNISPARFVSACMQRNLPFLFQHVLRPRAQNSHKGDFGRVQIIGGARGMVGAALLAARSALYSGAGRVYLATLGHEIAYDSQTPELMYRKTHDLELVAGVVRVVGPGLGTTDEAHELLNVLLDQDARMVIDADALNLLARDTQLQQKVWERGETCLLTPHPLEAARLLGLSLKEVVSDRPSAARNLAEQMNATVILKGTGSIITCPKRDEFDKVRLVINPTGNPGLATGGTGDVLSGLCGALLAQGLPFWETALAAAWLHGVAADSLLRKGIGPIGLTAGELIPVIRKELNNLIGCAFE